jgi:paraquat-inducible protein A
MQILPMLPGDTAESRARSLEVTAALSLAALILYVPANLYPILRMNRRGAYSESTVWDGVTSLAQHDQWFVAVVVFLASIAIPLAKLLALFFLVGSARFYPARWREERRRIYGFIDAIGPWAMLDVFLLAVLVALVKLGDFATMTPGPGLVAFACMVVLTMFASASFGALEKNDEIEADA